jgi:hypothetical protein
MKEVDAFDAQESARPATRTGRVRRTDRHRPPGREVAGLVPPNPPFDRDQASAAIKRLRDRAAALKRKIILTEIKAYRDEGRP